MNSIMNLKQEGLARQVSGVEMGLTRVEFQIVKSKVKLESQNREILTSINMLSEKISTQTERVAKLVGGIKHQLFRSLR